ncbi:MAPEG family protein [Methylobacterium sp. JK268]
MIYPAQTAVFAALLALLYVGLSGWVIGRRVSGDVLHGDAGDAALHKRIRSHGNFAEYVPFALLLIGWLEAGGGSPRLVEGLLIVLLIARVLHPVGMLAPRNSPRQFACRGGGIVATLAVTGIAAIALLVRAA